jgi:hypothetical protein
LITKIQHNNFETGEFTEEKERTLEQTIQLIEAFPWEQQRKDLHVSLTNPSVTVEGTYHHFLKLSLYYNGSFVLYYLDDSNRLYLKSLTNYQQAYPFITSFYQDSLVDTADWEHQHNWLQGKKIHFADKDFHYRLRRPLIIGAFFLACLYLLFLLTTTIALIIQGFMGHRPFFFISIPLILFLILGTLLIAQFFNQWRYAKGKVLILSKGNDLFYFGSDENPRAFNKEDIQSIRYISPRKLPSGKFGNFIRIDLKANETGKETESLYLPSILIRDQDALPKFPSFQIGFTRKLFPFIPRDVSAPS